MFWVKRSPAARARQLVCPRSQIAQLRYVLRAPRQVWAAAPAGVIHVMHEGRVVEADTHAELGGRYATSWRLQMREIGAAESAGVK